MLYPKSVSPTLEGQNKSSTSPNEMSRGKERQSSASHSPLLDSKKVSVALYPQTQLLTLEQPKLSSTSSNEISRGKAKRSSRTQMLLLRSTHRVSRTLSL